MANVDIIYVPEYVNKQGEVNSVALLGPGTANYIDAMKEAKGRYNKSYTNPANGQTMAGWTFSLKRAAEVEQLYNDIQSGVIAPTAAPVYTRGKPSPARTTVAPRVAAPTAGTAAPAAIPVPVPRAIKRPATKLPAPTLEMQEITYRVPKPLVGMKADLTVANVLYPARVTVATPSASGAVDRIAVTLDGSDTTYDVAVVAGQWQLLGDFEPHTVAFST